MRNVAYIYISVIFQYILFSIERKLEEYYRLRGGRFELATEW